jgi:hypothetical protein
MEGMLDQLASEHMCCLYRLCSVPNTADRFAFDRPLHAVTHCSLMPSGWQDLRSDGHSQSESPDKSVVLLISKLIFCTGGAFM